MKKITIILLLLTIPMLSCAVLDGSGTVNYIPKYYSETSIGISSITDNGTHVTIPNLIVSGSVNATSLSSTNNHTHNGTSGYGGQLIQPYINEAVSMNVTSTYINQIDDNDYLTILTNRYRYSYISPVNPGTSASGSGSGSAEGSWFELSTGATALSKIGKTFSTNIFWSHSASSYRPNWDKAFVYLFTVRRNFTSDANVISRVQIKDSQAIGALAEKGIGLRIENYKLYGESYGTSGLASLDLSTTMTGATPYDIIIIHTPATSIKWYVNGVLKNTQSTAGNIPAGEGSAYGGFMNSIENNQAGNDCIVWIGMFLLGVAK